MHSKFWAAEFYILTSSCEPPIYIKLSLKIQAGGCNSLCVWMVVMNYSLKLYYVSGTRASIRPLILLPVVLWGGHCYLHFIVRKWRPSRAEKGLQTCPALSLVTLLWSLVPPSRRLMSLSSFCFTSEGPFMREVKVISLYCAVLK